MPKISYNGKNGKFDIVDVEKRDLKELVDILDKNVVSDKMRIFQMDLQDDIEIMNINIKDKDIPF